MPLNTLSPIMHLDPAALTNLDTNNVMDFHGLWSVLSKCADTMENGKRLEYLSWRLFSREAFVCNGLQRRSSLRSSHHRLNSSKSAPSADRIPELSSSVDSNASSDFQVDLSSRAFPTSARPEILRADSSRHPKSKHISPLDLEKMVITINDRTTLEPLSPLPLSLSMPPREVTDNTQMVKSTSTPLPSISEQASEDTEITPVKAAPKMNNESSTSTVATQNGLDVLVRSPTVGSEDSSSTEVSEPKIIRGFSRECVSSFNHSRTHLATPTQSILKTSPRNVGKAAASNKKKGFIIGASSEEKDGSSFESHINSLRPSGGKKTSFRDEVLTHAIKDKQYESEGVFEDTDEESESESAIDDDDEYEDDWEDEEESASVAQVDERDMFQRVDSRPNLTSRRSLLTTQLHEGDRASALQNAASRSTSAIRRSRTTSPNGPIGSSPEHLRTLPFEVPQAFQQDQASGSRPITMTTSQPLQPLLSPRTARRNMLKSEMTASLRTNIIWERQQKKMTTDAVLRRRHTSRDVQSLQQFPGPSGHNSQVHLNRLTAEPNHNYYDSGLQDYHQTGW